ncbi:leucyl/phenylalanyl-tRNA--protein transferase, partial [Pandoraea nosoerga]|nr:leucyl/phenylalanyl-tRNA--protein transferase [Pandoraea nosoerga]
HRTDASKIALAALCAFLGSQGVAMIDCQQETEHLASLGGAPVPRAAFLAHVREAANAPAIVPWHFDKSVLRRWTVRNEQA